MFHMNALLILFLCPGGGRFLCQNCHCLGLANASPLLVDDGATSEDVVVPWPTGGLDHGRKEPTQWPQRAAVPKGRGIEMSLVPRVSKKNTPTL